MNSYCEGLETLAAVTPMIAENEVKSVLCMCAMRKKRHFLTVYILSFYFGQLAQLTQDNLDNLSKTFQVKPEGSISKLLQHLARTPKKQR